MVSFEEAGAMLDEIADDLPREIYENLNGGVNLIPARKTDESGLLVMGMYFVDQMGRHVELYYGSFCEAFPDATAEVCRRELAKTLKHELTHHLENQAWDRTLEKWDERHTAELLGGLYDEPLDTDSILFVSADDGDLGPMANALFRVGAAQRCPEVRTASAGVAEAVPERANPKAAAAASALGADFASYIPRRATRELMGDFDAVLCMTEEQCEELSAMFPGCDGKIMCLGERDLTPPLLGGASGWKRTAEKVAAEIDYLIDELCGEDDNADS